MKEGANMKRIIRTAPACLAALAVALLVMTAAAVRAQVLDQVPSDALAVLEIKNLNALNEKAAALAKQFGIVEMNPMAADPLGALLQAGGITGGVNKDGDAALALLNGDLNGEEPPLIGLIPVTDYAAFLKNFGDAAKDGEFDVVHFTFNGEKDKDNTYVANWGKYAAIADKKEHLAKKPDGFKTAGATAKEISTKDVAFVVNMKVLGPKLSEQIKAHQDELLAKVDQAIAGQEKAAKYGPLAKAVVNQMLAMVQQLLTETRHATLSLNLNKDGIGLALLGDFTPDSYLGKNVSSIRGTDGPLLTGLPEAKYIIFGGNMVSGETGQKMFEDALRPIEVELGKGGDEMRPIVTMVEAVKKVIAASKGQTMGVIAPTGALGATSLLQTVAISTGDAKVLLGMQQTIMEAQQKLMAMLPNQPQMKLTFADNAKTVDGVQFNQFTNEVAGNDAVAAQVKQMFAMLYGPAGATGYTGAIDDQHVLTVSGLEDPMISAAIKAVKEKQDNLSKQPGVTLVNQNLPPSRKAVFYLALGELVTTGTNYARMMGMPIPVNIKPDLAPLGFAAGTDGSAARMDVFVPADLVEAMVTTGLQLKVMGQGGRGKPGGLSELSVAD